MTIAYEVPRRVVLGADAWQLVVRELGGLALPMPLREQDGAELDAAQETAALRALNASGVLTGFRPLEDLHPSLRAGLAVHLRPAVVLDTVVQRGPERTTARHAVAGVLASGLRRTTVELAGGRRTGPVEVSSLLVDDLATEVVGVLGELAPVGDRTAMTVDAATSLAVVRAVRQGRPEIGAALTGGQVPGVLDAVAGGVVGVARIELAGLRRRRGLVLLETAQGWWSVHTSGEDVVLRPVDTDVLVMQVATALTATLTAGGAGSAA